MGLAGTPAGEWREGAAAGYLALLMSPANGLTAAGSSFTSLSQAPHHRALASLVDFELACHRCAVEAAMGTRLSEVKEEAWSQTGPGDTSASGYPSMPIAPPSAVKH